MHILFLIHGMGRQNENWSVPVTDKLVECSGLYQQFQDKSLTDEVVFVPLRYDQVFDDLLDRWKNDFSGILNSEDTDDIPRGKLLTVMNSMTQEERDFFWSHIADVLIYRFFPLYRDRVRIELIRTIAKHVTKYRDQFGNNTRFSFLAHSLGTSVIHDSLHLLGATEWDDEVANVMGPPHTRFQALFMLANTSRILESDVKVSDSIVCPVGGHNDETKEYLDQYYNAFHKYDPITLIRKIDGSGMGSNFHQVNISHFRNVNVHDFSHYLDHPAVHIPLLRTLCGFRAVLPAEQVHALDVYEDIDRQSLITEIQSRVESAQAQLGDNSTIADLVKIWVSLKDVIVKTGILDS